MPFSLQRYGQNKQASTAEQHAWAETITTLQDDAFQVQEQINIAQGKSTETQAAHSQLWTELEASFEQEKEQMEALIEQTAALIQDHTTKCAAAAKEYAETVAKCN